MLRRLAVLALALVPALLASTADPAAAAWAVKGAGPARALAVTIPQGATPAATKATSAPSYLPVYTLTWSTTSLPAGQAVLGYQVRRTVFPRTAVARVEPISAGSCAGTTVSGLTNVYVPADPTARTQSCTDTNAYSTGEVTFTVTPVIGPWVGPTSPASPVYS